MRRWLVVGSVVAALAGCQEDLASDRSTPGLLEVTSVEVVVAESFPPQVRARVLGLVPNVCTSVDQSTVRRDGRTLEVTITTRTEGTMCVLMMPPPVETVVPLEGPFEAGEYVVRVNGMEARFRL